MLNKLRGGGLSVGARDRDHRTRAHAKRQLELADQLPAFREEVAHQGRRGINPGAQHTQVIFLSVALRRLTRQDPDASGLERLDLAVEPGGIA